MPTCEVGCKYVGKWKRVAMTLARRVDLIGGSECEGSGGAGLKGWGSTMRRRPTQIFAN